MPRPVEDLGLIDATVFQDQRRTNLRYIVEELIAPHTKSIIYGRPKEWKSHLALQLAYCIATGQDFLGWRVSPARVVYTQFEIYYAFLGRRMDKVKQVYAQYLEADSFYLCPQINLTLVGEDAPRCKNLIKAWLRSTEAKVLILDPLQFLLYGTNENETIPIAISFFEELLVEFPELAVVIVHHMRKGIESRPSNIMDELRGGYLAGWADTIIAVESRGRREDGMLFRLTPFSRIAEEDLYAIETLGNRQTLTMTRREE